MSDNSNIEDKVLIVIIAVGILLCILFYFLNAKDLSAIFISLAMAALVYRFLGGITNASFTAGFLKLSGSAAFVIGCMYFISTQLFSPTGKMKNNQMELGNLKNDIHVLDSTKTVLIAQNDSLNNMFKYYKTDLGLYFAQVDGGNNTMRNSKLAIKFLISSFEGNNNIDDMEKIKILNSLVNCSEYMSQSDEFEKLLAFLKNSPMDKFNLFRNIGRVYYHYADDPFNKLNLSNDLRISLWKKCFNNYLNAYTISDMKFSDQDKKDLINGVIKLNYLMRIKSISDLEDAIKNSDKVKFGNLISQL